MDGYLKSSLIYSKLQLQSHDHICTLCEHNMSCCMKDLSDYCPIYISRVKMKILHALHSAHLSLEQSPLYAMGGILEKLVWNICYWTDRTHFWLIDRT